MIRKYIPEDYKTIASWWIDRESTIPSRHLFSDIGFMATDDQTQEPICAIFMYPTHGSSICVIGWPVTNPNTNKEQRSKALDSVLEATHSEAKKMGYSYIWTTSGVKPVEERLTKHGYLIGDVNINQYWKGLE